MRTPHKRTYCDFCVEKTALKLKTCIKILIALGLALIVPVTNYLVDPAGIYTQSLAGSTEGTVVQPLLSAAGQRGSIPATSAL